MKRITGSLVVCAGAGLFTAGALLLDPGENSTPPSAVPATVRVGTAASTAPTLEIDKFKFGSITVKPGTAVTISNRDNATHTVTADKGAFNSKANAKSMASMRAPLAPGAYSFFCAIHPEMKGTLTVK